MSALAADLAFDFSFPSPCATPPPSHHDDDFAMDSFHGFAFDSSLLELPYNPRHARSSSKASSIYSAVSTVDSAADSVCTRLTTPPRASPPVRSHGPALLPKIRSQDQDFDHAFSSVSGPAAAFARMTPPPAPASRPSQASHARSYTNPETLASMAYAHMSSFAVPAAEDDSHRHLSPSPAPLLCSPADFANRDMAPRRASTCGGLDSAVVDKYGYPTYRQLPLVSGHAGSSAPQHDFVFPSFLPRSSSPLSIAAAPEPTPSQAPSTTLMAYLTGSNPAASLVQSISFPFRDPTAKHFWWDIRSIRSWSSFNASAVLALSGASALLTTPVPAPVLPDPSMNARHPDSEASLHRLYASYYLPKLNSALAISSSRPLQLSVPAKSSGGVNDLLFVANAAGESASAAVMFGGKPAARIVGLVRGFDRFNTGMRVEGNIKRVEYLRGLAAIHHAMREHGCRYGFILTEIELVVVRNGSESTPFFGDVQVTSVHLGVSATDDTNAAADPPLTACLALWGLCQLAGDDTPAGHVHWKAEIGAPAEGTRRKARARDTWMPQPQLAEKREAKRSRGWVWPEDAIGRKELGKRGVKYGGL